MQKYIHLVQIVETEKVAANQLRTQLEDQETEIERLKAEVDMFSVTHYSILYVLHSVFGHLQRVYVFNDVVFLWQGFSVLWNHTKLDEWFI